MDGQFPSKQPLTPTPKQVRAARALLGWSQQELANRAGIATSTVADFERGHRTPVPNNADAIREALTGAGITFLPGGAIEGPPLPSLAPIRKGGVPIRWVTATDLTDWSQRRDGQSNAPTLIANLVKADSPSTLRRFPSDEGVQYSGWDGMTDAKEASEYVPAGKAGWEIGTQRTRIVTKANADYDKRTADPLGLDAASSTFIFVTTQHWPEKEAWAQKKRQDGTWRDVRAYDGDDLVHWIELYPAVGRWLATATGKQPAGVLRLDELWEEWSRATQPPLTTELVLSDRDEDANAILRWLRSEATPLALQAETANEAVAFFFAAINQLPAEAVAHYEARCLVATTGEAARMLADSATPLIIILFDPEPGLAGAIAKKRHHVFLAYGGNAGSIGDVRRLERPSREGIEIALQNAGIPEDRARRLARDSSRSLAILRRLIPTAPGRLPVWAQVAPPHALLAALLIGAWDETSDADRAILSKVGNRSYDELIEDLTDFAGTYDRPLRKVGTVWKVASPPDAWSLLAPYLAAPDISRFTAAAIEVLGAGDPRFDLEPGERWLASMKGAMPAHSPYLRHGIGETLILIALFGDRARNVSSGETNADRVVRSLLHKADRKRWWSLSGDFRLLAEASPREFLDAIGEGLRDSDPAIAQLFVKDDDPMFGREYLSSLLWALEALAWSPDYLTRAAETLAALDSMDPGGRFGNRPANSLREIFVLWSPQTNATLEQRLRVLDRLRPLYPKPSWKLLLGILPAGHDSLSPTPTPRWRDFTPERREIVTYELIGKGAEAVAERLLTDVGTNAQRWEQLLKRLNDLAPDRSAAMRKFAEVAPIIDDPADRTVLWEALRGILNHHRQFLDAEWALPETDLSRLEVLYDALAPTDPVQRVAWLFETNVDLPRPVPDGWKADNPEIMEERKKAAKALLDARGIDGVFELARAVETAGFLGAALAEIGVDARTLETILERALRSDDPRERNIAHGMIVATFPKLKEPWAEGLLEKAAREKWGVEPITTILRALPVRRWTWDQAHALGSEIERSYWERAPVLWIEGEVADTIFAITKLIEVKRARHALSLAGHHLKASLPSELLVEVLRRAVREPLNDGDRNAGVMTEHYVSEVLKRLDKAPDVPENTMAELEWAYLPLLHHSGRPVTALFKALSEQPAFFMQVLSAVFKPSEESGIVEEPPENTERAQNIASQAYDLLRMWNRVPGTQPDNTIDSQALQEWVTGARELAQKSGRLEIADQKIGEVLSAAPAGSDGVWPALPVRELIDKVQSSRIENGFVVGRLNRRGVTSRMPRDGGAQERVLVEQYRGFARATAVDWPRTSAALDLLARHYEQDAARHDEAAERLDWE